MSERSGPPPAGARDLARLLSGERFEVDYLLTVEEGGGERAAREKAWDLCLEQTVELPDDLVPPGPIRDHVLGRIVALAQVAPQQYRASISFAVEVAGGDLVQLLNVVYGNVSLKPGCRVERLRLPAGELARFKGPRFGAEGLRELLRVPRRPLLCTALKPQGLSAPELASQAGAFAQGGVDLVKDDHGLADQVFSPFEERVERCAAAVAEANSRTGLACRYMANVTAPAERVQERAHRAKALGAGALLVCPALAGLDAMRRLAEDDALGLPVMAHPAFMGSFVTSPVNGFSHGALFGTLMRLAGADCSVYPNWGGRFSFSVGECTAIAEACAEPAGHLRAILPAPGGGMTTDRAPEMIRVYGRDFVLLIGGGLHRRGPDLAANARHFVEMLERL